MLRAASHGGDDVRLNRYQGLNDHILDAMKHRLEVYAYLLKIVLKLCEVPLRGVVLFAFLSLLSPVGSRVLDVVLVLFVDGVVS